MDMSFIKICKGPSSAWALLSLEALSPFLPPGGPIMILWLLASHHRQAAAWFVVVWQRHVMCGHKEKGP